MNSNFALLNSLMRFTKASNQKIKKDKKFKSWSFDSSYKKIKRSKSLKICDTNLEIPIKKEVQLSLKINEN